MKYRSRTEIVDEILNAANGGGATKTKIMHQAYLSHDQMKEYLTVLTESGLLNYDVYTRKFKTTEKGLRFLDTYNQMSDVMKTNNNNINYSIVAAVQVALAAPPPTKGCRNSFAFNAY